ncbi:MAG: adenylate/guanylate cyclase domain-containing protein [Sporichthyaceae bacterium]
MTTGEQSPGDQRAAPSRPLRRHHIGDPDAAEYDTIPAPPSAADLERRLLRGDPDITLSGVAAAAGISPEVASLLWHALGFPDVEPPGKVFTSDDKAAMARLARLVDESGADEEFAVSLIRGLGHHMSRLAMWQVIALVAHMSEMAGNGEEGAGRAVAFMTDHLDDLESLLLYSWRRHLAAGVRWRLGRIDEDASRFTLTVAFADMVAYTRLAQQMDPLELSRLVGRFESVSANIVLRQGGRIIKTVGDEILFVGDTAGQAVAIALDLANAMGSDPLLPDVRVGVATGEVVGRMGDVFGPTVNLASRLTDVARPGSVLVDEATAAVIAGDEAIAAATLETDLDGFGPVTAFELRRLPRPEG